jgi:hypothetical protein
MKILSAATLLGFILSFSASALADDPTTPPPNCSYHYGISCI